MTPPKQTPKRSLLSLNYDTKFKYFCLLSGIILVLWPITEMILFRFVDLRFIITIIGGLILLTATLYNLLSNRQRTQQ